MSQYATSSDFTNFGINAIAIANIDPAVVTAQLQAASDLMDSYFNGRYRLPLSAWDNSVRMNCCWIAAWLVLSKSRGFNPDNPSDVTVRASFDDAIAWCNGVQRQAIHPTVTQAAQGAVNYDLPQVSTLPPRGW
jgi:phage gp36-like protein